MTYKVLLLLTLIFVAVRASESNFDPEHDFENDYDNDFYKGQVTCKHGELQHNPGLLDIEEEDDSTLDGEGRRLTSTSYPQLRIYPYYNILAASAPATYTSYIEYQLVPPIVSYFEAALKVKYSVSGALKVPSVQTTICGATTPSVLLNGGVAADFFIFFDSEYDGSSSWVAESYVCFIKNPGTDVLLHEKNTYLLIHEMTHSLGFSTSLYPYFLDSNGKIRTGHIKSGVVDGSTSTVLSTPTLTTALRNFFGCSSLAGAYMENSGSTATAGSHFERRQFVFEYMSSGLVYQQRISEFTFALLEDSGWYVPDYTYAEPYYFGQGQGCGFLFNECTGSSFTYDEFCKTTTSTRGCSFQGRGGGTCQSDLRSDGCKYYSPDVNDDCNSTGAASYARLSLLQTFGRGAGS